jgi:methionyl-tRNA formyltransferase
MFKGGKIMLRVIIMTQQDRFFIPANIQKVIDHSEVLMVVNVNVKNSLHNKITDFIKWFGFFQVIKMGVLTVQRSLVGFLDKLFNYSLKNGLYGIEHIARKNKIPYKVIHSSNSIEFVQEVEKLKPDLILSFSAPEVIKEPLLSLPKHGILNVHGSYLPEYRGCMPSFWHLHNEEEYAGASVHFMSKKIDDGDIVIQEKVHIGDCNSIMEVIQKTKEKGGDLIVKAIQIIESGVLKTKPNDTSKGKYYSWPTAVDASNFKARNKKLI